jgi:hypothetical protein
MAASGQALVVILHIEFERAIREERELAHRPWLLTGDGHTVS